MTERVWSTYQTAIFDWLEQSQPSQNLAVIAVAGSGKSTTIQEGHSYLPLDMKVLDLAFNKHIAIAMQNKLPDANVKTYHAAGLKSVTNSFRRLNVNGFRNDDILKKRLGSQRSFMFSPIKRLVSLFKANLEPYSWETVNDYVLYYGIDVGDIADSLYHQIGEEVNYLLQPDNIVKGEIDFDDMCWLPVQLDLPCEKFDFIFIDELQDTNKNQIELALKHANGSSRIVGVGDPWQAIYGWRGADVDAIPNLVARLQANTLPLSITYRNPQKIVDLVTSKYPQIGITARDNAPDGIIENKTPTQFLNSVQPGDMVLCRVNAPLVAPAMQLISQGKKAIIKGKDIGKNLQSLVRKIIKRTNPTDFEDFLYNMQEFCHTEIMKLQNAEKYTQAGILEDNLETIFALSEFCKSTDDLLYRIEMIFSDDIVGVTFSSVHRAKGLESENVYILHPELIPHPRAKLAWQIRQEANLEYVAYTRSLNGLYFVM